MTKQRQMVTLDCETDPFLHGRIPKPFVWDVFDGHQHYTFEHVSDCIHLCAQREWDAYAHNGGKFDYHMPGFLDQLSPYAAVKMINGRLSEFTIGNCRFRDSYNILPIALSQYEKISIDYAKMEANVRHKHMAEITRYLRGDTESLYKLVYAFKQEYGDSLTLAGSAMKFWQNRTGLSVAGNKRHDADFYTKMEPYYYGGRVQVFTPGIVKGPIHVLDINSAYPHAMLSEHPFSTTPEIDTPHRGQPIIPQSFYTVCGVSRGAFPYRQAGMRGGKLTFPTDDAEREYSVTGWELAAARESGSFDCRKIIRRVSFRKLISFTKYVEYFYQMKVDAGKKFGKNSPEYIYAKLFLNSLYGKFGAHPESYRNYCVVPRGECPQDESGNVPFATELGKWDLVAEPLKDHEKWYYNLATAASITGYVRAQILKAQHAVRHAGGTVHYTDTDSIMLSGCDPEHVGGVVCGRNLGEWNNEGTYDVAGFGGKKLYALRKGEPGKYEWKTACKGARLTPQEIMKIVMGGEVTYESQAPTNMRTFIKRRIKATV